ncbi:DNA-3-methyladenine glycosylase I [Pseudogemmobacter bohemicus]|uniref:DNA-3-methyladenine glycosylase I n=1 Tax=Pseudogemmobacter bohemicus TaxID=2250708 RepID=UPI000DD47462|nr:DNA-3-methyladenine glycosylase I [Pseudogemmobacter bohemicus]
MRSFEEILAIAAGRKGGQEQALAGIIQPLTADQLAALPDAAWLSQMARGIFQAGISWKVVDAKWPGIEEAFQGFDPGAVSMLDEDRIEALVNDRRLIRSGPKILAIRENAQFIRDTTADYGSFGRRVGDWPDTDFIGLLAWLVKGGSRLGGATGAYMLRQMGKESFLLSQDVTARLMAEGVIDGPATSQKSLRAVQAAFDGWKAESGRSFNEISVILARSIG